MAFNFNVKEIESADIQQSASLSIMMKIIELPETISRKISTGQVIITLTGACRELIDNSLDANATNIEIRVKENGTESLEVLDNGSGISVENFEQLCRPHCTSKLAELDDFNSLNSYGFRGEALNALATLSDVQIVTRDAESRCAWRLCFGRNGEILNREQCSRQQGTTISVLHLFKLLPVRRQEFLRNSRREFLKLVECVQAFALSHPNCRFTLSNIVNGKRSQHLISPGGSATLPEVIGSLFGVGIGHKNELLELEEVVVPSEEVEYFYGIAHKNHQNITEKIYQNTRLSGFISNCEPGQGRSNSDRQFIFVNRRHIDYPKLCRIANEIYGAYNRGQFPILVLFIDVPPSIIDVNISPDKRIVLFHHEKELFAKFRAILLATFTKVQGACPAATISSINQFQQKPITKAIQQFGKNSPKLDKEAEKSFNLDENQIDIPQYSVFMHEASNSAINSTFIGEEENFIMDLDKSNENDDIVEREECSTTKTAEIIVSPNANESAFFHENSFNPDDSRNLRDSFVLAESTPKMVDGIRGSPKFDGITPIRRNVGFQSAASIFKEANNEENERNQQNGNGFGGFQTAAKLFQKSGKSFEIVSEKLNQKENCHHKSAHFPTFSQINEVDAEIQLESPMKRAKLLELDNEFIDKTPQNKPNICQQFPSTSTAAENDCNSPSPSPSLLLSPNSSIFEEEDIPAASSSSIPHSNSGISIGRPHQKIVVNLQNLRRRFEMFRKEINEEGNKKKKNDEKENIPIIEEAELNFNEKNEEIVKREIERKLSLMLKKSDFGRMKLIGQFNNAFLIGRLGPELFMIDQHAADEKYNFECLQAKMAVKSQKLINAQKLKLGTVNVAILKDNLELFRKNGFDFKFEEEEEEEDGTKGGFVQLISTPNINGYHFDKHDIDQLISLISELPGQLHRPNKIRAIFASKACRKSVMFGQALADSKMEEIIKNMGQMAAPWNCPHGRPTIRHLCTIHTNKII